MSAAPVEPIVPTEPTEPPVATATPPAPTPTEPPKANPWEDPAAAEAEIKRLRQEAGAARTNAKAQAAEEARTELAASISKILNPEATPLDPAELTKSLTTSQADAKQARVELAVFRNAAAAQGDPAALLDSTSFLKSLDAIDPSDSRAITAAIQAAVASNPRLGMAGPAETRTPAPNPAQGTSAGGAPGLDAQIADATKAGNHQLAIALKQQRSALLAKS